MSIFGSIMSKIFSHGEAAAAPASAPSKPTAGASPAAAPGSAAATSPGSPPGAAHTDTAPSHSAAAPQQPVDVAANLTALAAQNPQQLDWRHSIVDLLKLLDLDSSFASRKQLAQELHYAGDSNDSATMNIWLHKQVMVKLAENGGKVPDDLRV